MAISTSGVGSGIDIRSLVDELLAAEGQAKTIKYDRDETENLAKITGIGTIKSSLTEFQSSLSTLKDITQFQKRSASSEDDDIFTVTADTNATAGSYDIEITQLAVNHKLHSADFAAKDTIIGTGNIKFTIGTVEHSVAITSNDQTLEGIKNRINETSSTTGITATLVTSDAGTKIAFTAKDAGVDNIFTVSITDDGDSQDADNAGLSQLSSAYLTTQQAGLDSIIKIDGATLTSSTNTIEDAIDGVTINLLDTNIGDAKKLTVSLDKLAANAAVNQFVSGYNSVVDSINELTKYNEVAGETDAGILIGDATVRSIEYQLRRELNEMIQTIPGSFRSLSEIGVTTNQLTGKLQVQSSKLTNALDTNFDAVGQLFAKDDVGVAVRLDLVVDNFVKSQGILDSKTDTLSREIEDINDQRLKLERRLVKLEERLLSQFIAMDGLVAGLRNTSDFLTQQLDKLPEPQSFTK